jgi:hypothetical protein
MYLYQILAYCHRSQEKFRLAYSHCLHDPIGKDKSWLRLAYYHCPHLFRRKSKELTLIPQISGKLRLAYYHCLIIRFGRKLQRTGIHPLSLQSNLPQDRHTSNVLGILLKLYVSQPPSEFNYLFDKIFLYNNILETQN